MPRQRKARAACMSQRACHARAAFLPTPLARIQCASSARPARDTQAGMRACRAPWAPTGPTSRKTAAAFRARHGRTRCAAPRSASRVHQGTRGTRRWEAAARARRARTASRRGARVLRAHQMRRPSEARQTAARACVGWAPSRRATASVGCARRRRGFSSPRATPALRSARRAPAMHRPPVRALVTK